MATNAVITKRSRNGAAPAPISSHPAFPAIVALWFAALLGLGSLILPAVLLERLTVVTGIASLVPAAAPPLGFTARAILALAAALAGAAMGILLARKVAQKGTYAPRERVAADEPICRPISAHDELGEEGLAPSEEGFGRAAPRAPTVHKRRALAIAEDTTKSHFLNAAPLPGHNGEDLVVAQTDDDGALELGAFAEPGDDAGLKENAMTDSARFIPTEEDFEVGEEEVEIAESGARQEFQPVPPTATNPFADFDVEDEPEEEEADDELADALAFSAPSLRRKVPVLELPPEDDEDDDMPDFSLPQASQKAKVPAPAVPQAYEPAPEPAPKLSVVQRPEPSFAEAFDLGPDDRELSDLGLVQLAARLGASLERRRAQRAAMGFAAPATRAIFSDTTEDFDAAAADEAARARADFFGGSTEIEEEEIEFGPEAAADDVTGDFSDFATQDFDEEEDENFDAPASATFAGDDFDEDVEEDDLAASFSLPLRKKPAAAARPFASFDVDDEDSAGEAESDAEEDGSEEEYSSLLAMKNPFQRTQPEFVRVEEPEPEPDEFEATVVFPRRKQEAQPAVEAPAPEAVARPFDPPAGAKPRGAPRDHSDAERELRAALETLQRMSGAA